MAAPQDMNGYLNQILGINNAGMRNRLIDKGFEDFDEIQFYSTKDVTRICDNIRKTNDGNVGQRAISVPVEENLEEAGLAHKVQVFNQQAATVQSGTHG